AKEFSRVEWVVGRAGDDVVKGWIDGGDSDQRGKGEQKLGLRLLGVRIRDAATASLVSVRRIDDVCEGLPQREAMWYLTWNGEKEWDWWEAVLVGGGVVLGRKGWMWDSIESFCMFWDGEGDEGI